MTDLRIAGAPITGGVCEVPGWGARLPVERVLHEMAGLGLTATESGPESFLPVDPADPVDPVDPADPADPAERAAAAAGVGVQEGPHRPLGEGDVDVRSLLAALLGAGYDGWSVLEQDTVLRALPVEGEGPVADAGARAEHLRALAAELTA